MVVGLPDDQKEAACWRVLECCTVENRLGSDLVGEKYLAMKAVAWVKKSSVVLDAGM